jgi:hypothetical protein
VDSSDADIIELIKKLLLEKEEAHRRAEEARLQKGEAG